MALHRKGGLPNGREVTVTGHISGISEVYQKDGQTLLRKRPEIKLTGAQILDGGLGRSPKSEAMPSTTNQVVTMAPVKKPTVDKTPTLEDIAFWVFAPVTLTGDGGYFFLTANSRTNCTYLSIE